MKWLVLFTLLSCQAWGAVTFLQAAHHETTSGTNTVTISYQNGSTVWAFVSVAAAASRTVSSITDTGGCTWSQSKVASNGNNAQGFLWACTNAIASTSLTVTLSGTYTAMSVGVLEYTNANKFPVNNSGFGTSTTPQIACTSAPADAVSVMGFTAAGTASISANTGNLRVSDNSIIGMAMVDILGATTGIITLGASEAWGATCYAEQNAGGKAAMKLVF